MSELCRNLTAAYVQAAIGNILNFKFNLVVPFSKHIDLGPNLFEAHSLALPIGHHEITHKSNDLSDFFVIFIDVLTRSRKIFRKLIIYLGSHIVELD